MDKSEEEILKLKKIATLLKKEYNKLKEENELLKKNNDQNKEQKWEPSEENYEPASEKCETLDENYDQSGEKEDVLVENSLDRVKCIKSNELLMSRLKNEMNRRIILEKNYKKLKEFTIILEERYRNEKNVSREKYKDIEDKLEECNKNLKKSKNENELLIGKIKEKDIIIYKLNKKIEEIRVYLKGDKNIHSIENQIDEMIGYKLEIKKLKDNLEICKKTEEITIKERHQYKSMIMLCSQYKEKCKKIPILESKIDILESEIKELQLYKIKDTENIQLVKELKDEILNYQIENNKLNEQINEWKNFSKLYINNNSIDIDNLKKTMNDIHNKYNQVNLKKTDLEVKYKKLSMDVQVQKNHLNDKILELKIMHNRNKHLEKKIEFIKMDYMYQLGRYKDKQMKNDNLHVHSKNEVERNENIGHKYSDIKCDGNYKDKDDDDNKGDDNNNNDHNNDHNNDNDNNDDRHSDDPMLTQNYKCKYEFIEKDNKEKEKLIEELKEKLEKYKNEYDQFILKQKNVEICSQELLLYEKEITYLKEEIENYKNKIVILQNDIIHVNNQWSEDNKKNEMSIKELKEVIKKIQFDAKINMNNNKSDVINNMSSDHIKNDHIKNDHIKNDHIKNDHIKNDHIKNDHIKNDHTNINHTNINHIKSDIVHGDNIVYSNNSEHLNKYTDEGKRSPQFFNPYDKDLYNLLYTNLDDTKNMEHVELIMLKNENLYLKSKVEIMKLFYTNQIKTFREAFLYILGWDIKIEQNDEEIFFILTSLFSTHDGKFVFIKKKSNNEKQEENKTSLLPNKRNIHDIIHHDDHVLKKEKVKDNYGLYDHPSDDLYLNNINGNKDKEKENDMKNDMNINKLNYNNLEEDLHFYEDIMDEKNEINTDKILQKTDIENTNINMSTIMKGTKYNLLLNGYYSIKWKQNIEWKNYLNKINTYPILLSLLSIEEYNNIKLQYNNNLSKNFKGMLFKI
ncbi:hypothetical protein PFMG_00179 [Plasmodium falciparum IGH-CR14]|uniref:Uncharacterized protein n=1 Tax=Plasmodium falciparum IGH-CR14 TaxID=580059 RepID=A0A0L1I416_PLAFA|nr:hypothetical protein PFMG_00179 [Plasmodium falciparum IGH-CR14]